MAPGRRTASGDISSLMNPDPPKWPRPLEICCCKCFYASLCPYCLGLGTLYLYGIRLFYILEVYLV